MPSSSEILSDLARIANDWWIVAVLWHVALGGVLGAVALGWRPRARLAAMITSLPLVSVSLFAWLERNPFNGTVMGLAALVLVACSARASGAIRPGPRWAQALGAAILAFGWIYPHFLEGSAWLYLVAAPVGLVPCPSLSVVLGLGLCAGSFGSRAWAVAAASFGLFYGVFGVLHLGVALDLPLVAAAVAMLMLAASKPRLAAGA